MKYVLTVYLPGLILGFWSLLWTIHTGWWPVVAVGWVLVSGLGIATGFHRIFSHRTHTELRPWLDNLLLFLGTIGGQGSSISWVAVHRGYHHRHSDTDRDLHSPTVHGLWHALFGWYWNLTPETINHKYAVELLRRPNHTWVHKHYIAILYGWSCLLCAIDFRALVCWLAVLCVSLIQDNLVNSLCHLRVLGYRVADTKDNSINFWPLGYLGWGQGFHNFHHANPSRFSFASRWWELDLCNLFRPLLALGSKRNPVS